MLAREMANRLVELQAEYAKYYGLGLVALEQDAVHVREEFLAEMPGEMVEEHRGGPVFPWRRWKLYRGVNFFTLSEKSLEQEVQDDAGTSATIG